MAFLLIHFPAQPVCTRSERHVREGFYRIHRRQRCLYGICILEASTVGFPVPFFAQLGGSSMAIFIPLVIRFVLGLEPFASDSPHHPHLQRFYRFVIVYIMLIAGFPFYKVLYDQLPVKYQGCAIIILPVWKFAAKHLVIRASRELEVFIPKTVALSADFVSSLFVTVCISTSGSLYLTVAFIIVDLGQSMLEFREVHANANVVLDLHRERRQSREYLTIKKESESSVSDNLMATIIAVTRNPSAFNISSLSSARLRACLPHPITQDQAKTLKDLENSGVYVVNGSTRSTKLVVSQQKIRVSSASIAPKPRDFVSKTLADSYKVERERVQKSKQLVVQGLQLLFHCEYLALVEYVECIVPLVYVIYKSVVEQLPNISSIYWNITPAVFLLSVIYQREQSWNVLSRQLLFRRRNLSTTLELEKTLSQEEFQNRSLGDMRQLLDLIIIFFLRNLSCYVYRYTPTDNMSNELTLENTRARRSKKYSLPILVIVAGCTINQASTLVRKSRYSSTPSF
ncbi:hypothetical protein JG687_00018777 [Phytophthora cactorum]|uniref:Uncharacterized protein n=1 Tax=Phytophthora cactorum TaxID=29920 RepID=A0A8T1TK24_9STRA|nr:hypothetical protein JG687_00018777 [Phytophthora cactorum]